MSELSSKVKDLDGRSKAVEDAVKRTQKDLRETKRKTERVRGEMLEMNKQQKEMLDNMALLEMRQKQLNLKFRGVPEEMNENIRAKIIRELVNWMDLKEEDIEPTIVNLFRIKVRSVKAKGRKLPGDVLVMFNSMGIRNEIVRLNYNKNLCIDGKKIIVFKEVPIRFL